MTKRWIVWNNAEKGEGVVFDEYGDAHTASTGEHGQHASAIALEFFEHYGEDAPLQIEEIEVSA